MKYYGFNPFISAHQNAKEGVIYDLIGGDIYRVPPKVVELFSGNIYKSYEDIKEKAFKFGINENEVKNIIEEAKKKGIILELNKPYWRNEIKTSLESYYSLKQLPYFFRKVILQPTSKCDKNCNFCNNFVNCCCFEYGKEWGDKELENFLINIERFKGLIEVVEIFGGNPLAYSNIEKLISGLNKIHLKIVNINFPISSSFQWVEDKISKLKKICKTNLKTTFLVFPAYEDISLFLSKIHIGGTIKLFLDNKIAEEIEKKIEKGNKKFIFYKKYLLRKDLNNLEWYKEKINDKSLEGVHIHEFYFRKHFHRCWGYSFSVDYEGKIKPCLWSDIVFKSWEKGESLEAFIDDYNNTEGFYLDNNLENIEGCKNCIYRFSCNDCRVVAEYLAQKRKAKNPLCEK
jgi:organic radical activating enzyme